jgi:putative two-component system response regulator
LRQHDEYKFALKSWDDDLLITAACLHDIGKICVADDILNKADKLTEEEYAIIKQHTTRGKDIIDQIAEHTGITSFLTQAGLFAYYHHEKWDGTGYPEGLAGKDIPLQGRILTLIDVYDALRNVRSYKPALSHEKAIEIIERDKGIFFEPTLTDVFLKAAPKIDEYVREDYYYGM